MSAEIALGYNWSNLSRANFKAIMHPWNPKFKNIAIKKIEFWGKFWSLWGLSFYSYDVIINILNWKGNPNKFTVWTLIRYGILIPSSLDVCHTQQLLVHFKFLDLEAGTHGPVFINHEIKASQTSKNHTHYAKAKSHFIKKNKKKAKSQILQTQKDKILSNVK